MGVNRGKQFEEQVRDAFDRLDDVSVIRLIDPQNGFAGVRNICDFVVYHNPHQYLIECKSCYGNTLSFNNITDGQWNGLLEGSKVDGVIAGVLIWFIDHDKTIFVPIQILERMKKAEFKSVNIKSLSEDMYYVVPGRQRRVLFDYDFTSFLKKGRYLIDEMPL